MLKRLIMLATLVLLSAGAILAQDVTPEPLLVPFPEVVFYEPETGALYNVTADGTQGGANLSDVAAFGGQTAYNFVLSPDRALLAFAVNEFIADNESLSTLYVADVASGACCRELDPQDESLTGIVSALFSPDGTQIAVSYFNASYAPGVAGVLVVFDVATGAVVARLGSDELDNTLYDGQPQPGVFLHTWTDAGLIVSPTCVGCEPALEGMAHRWTPADGSLSAADVPFDLLGQPLPVTGESLEATLDPAFPNNPEAVLMIPVPNVVTYTPPMGEDGTVPEPQVIYFNPDNLYINWAQWVADGQAVFIQHSDRTDFFTASDEVVVLLRDGTRLPLTIPTARVFLAATSDGWVMMDNTTTTYVYYRLDGAIVEEIPLDATYTGYPVVVELPRFGASVVDAPAFPAVAAP